MKIFLKTVNIAIVFIFIFVIISAAGTAIFKMPFLMTAIKSNSMAPLWQRGDMLLIVNLPGRASIHEGDMIVFHSEEGSLAAEGWVAHRVVGGDKKNGFITKGDANALTDQKAGLTPRIKRKWIAGRVLAVAGHPIVIKKLGYLPILAANISARRFILPLIALFLAAVIAVSELTSSKRRKKKKSGAELPLIYMGAGVTLAMTAFATMLMNTQFITLTYQAGDKAAVSSAGAGTIPVGESADGNAAEMKNKSFLPFICYAQSNDPNITLTPGHFTLAPGSSKTFTYEVQAKEKGSFKAHLTIALFYPLLPASFIYTLASINIWLAFIVISIIPGLPFILYPLFDRRMRRSLAKGSRRLRRKWI